MSRDGGGLVLGVDPGKAGAIAAVSLNQYPDLWECIPWATDDMTALALLDRIAALTPFALVGVAVESQYVAANKATTVRLAQRAGRWEEACRVRGVPFAFVPPSSWQAAELGLSRNAKRGQLKAMSMSKVRGLFHPVKYDHCADAILLARYASLEHQRGRMRWVRPAAPSER